MIFIYNETDNPQWKVYKKNDYFTRIESLTNPLVGINLRSKDFPIEDFDQDLLNETNTVYNPKGVLNKPTAIRYDPKTLQPSINATDKKYNYDIYFITYDISDGRRIISEKHNNAYIYSYSYDYDKQQLQVIFSLNKKYKSYLEFILMSSDDKEVFLRHFMNQPHYKNSNMIYKSMKVEENQIIKQGDKGYIDTTDNYADGHIFRLPLYMPNRPSRLIFINSEEEKQEVIDLVKEHYKFNTDKIIFEVMTSENANTVAKKKAYDEMYSAATYYIPEMTKDELRKDRDAKKTIIDDMYGKMFKRVVALCKDGYIVKIKVS